MGLLECWCQLQITTGNLEMTRLSMTTVPCLVLTKTARTLVTLGRLWNGSVPNLKHSIAQVSILVDSHRTACSQPILQRVSLINSRVFGKQVAGLFSRARSPMSPTVEGSWQHHKWLSVECLVDSASGPTLVKNASTGLSIPAIPQAIHWLTALPSTPMIPFLWAKRTPKA